MERRNVKIIVTEVKNASKNLSVNKTAEERIHEHELKLVEITQTKANKEEQSIRKQTKQQKKTIRAEHPRSSTQYQMPYMYAIGIPEDEERYKTVKDV